MDLTELDQLAPNYPRLKGKLKKSEKARKETQKRQEGSPSYKIE